MKERSNDRDKRAFIDGTIGCRRRHRQAYARHKKNEKKTILKRSFGKEKEDNENSPKFNVMEAVEAELVRLGIQTLEVLIPHELVPRGSSGGRRSFFGRRHRVRTKEAR